MRWWIVVILCTIIISCVPPEQRQQPPRFIPVYQQPIREPTQKIPTITNVEDMVTMIENDFYDTEKFCNCRDACAFECGRTASKIEQRGNTCQCTCQSGRLPLTAPISQC